MADTQAVVTTATRPKRTYSPPRLISYGTVRELTRELSCNVNKDGGSNSVCRRT